MAEGLGIIQFSICAESHGMRKDRSPHQAHGNATFEIRGEQERELGIVLQAV
jgi:hypothetical protein